MVAAVKPIAMLRIMMILQVLLPNTPAAPWSNSAVSIELRRCGIVAPVRAADERGMNAPGGKALGFQRHTCDCSGLCPGAHGLKGRGGRRGDTEASGRAGVTRGRQAALTGGIARWYHSVGRQ